MGEATKASGGVLYEDKGRLSVREAGREPKGNKSTVILSVLKQIND